MPTDLTFFDTAAGLIPVLLLGGAITNRLREEGADHLPTWSWPLFVIAFFFFPATAEVFAIQAAMSDAPSPLQTWTVVVAVTFGTWALAASVAWPWLRLQWRHPTSRLLLLGGLVAMVVVCSMLLRDSVELEGDRQALAALTAEFEGAPSPLGDPLLRDLLDVEVEEVEARRDLGLLSRKAAAKRRLKIALQRRELLFDRAKREFDADDERLDRAIDLIR